MAWLDAVFLLYLLYNIADQFRKLADGELVAVANVNRTSLVRVHQRYQAVDEIVDVLEGAGLVAVAVHGHVLALERLDDEVGYDPSIERIHCGVTTFSCLSANLDVLHTART